MGLGALICELERGRPLGMSTVSEARWRDERWLLLDVVFEDEDELLDEEEDEDELLDERLDDLSLDEDDEDEDLPDEGTSRMLSSRPVVGSTVEASLGLWTQW
jgi:hypothetical protein